MQLRNPAGQRIKAGFISGRKKRIRVKSFIKQQMRRAAYADDEVVLGAVALSERISYLAREGVLSRLLKRWQMQLVVHPDPAFHSRAQRFGLELKRFESIDECGHN